MVRRCRAEWQSEREVRSLVCGSCWVHGQLMVSRRALQHDSALRCVALRWGQTHLVDNIFQDIYGQIQQAQRPSSSLLLTLGRMLQRLGGRCAHGMGIGDGKVARPGVVGPAVCRERVAIVWRGRERLRELVLRGQR